MKLVEKLMLSDYQSVFQLLAALYLVAEWVSVNKISEYYQERYRKEIYYRIRWARSYNRELNEIYNEFKENDTKIISQFNLEVNFSFFKKLCFFFFCVVYSV